ncbi:MAG: hypothetical protein KKB12_01210, partial [Candidatus Omnitrophica bacterium]|nr:hypothetical protein [Candidatus Omnitrophota bacterium]
AEDDLAGETRGEVKERVDKINKIRKNVNRTIAGSAKARQDLARFEKEEKEISKGITLLKGERARLETELRQLEKEGKDASIEKRRRREIISWIRSREDGLEDLLGSREKEILEKPYMKKDREEAVQKVSEDQKEEAERKKRLEQVRGLLERRKLSLKKNVAVAEKQKLEPSGLEDADKKPTVNLILGMAARALQNGELVRAEILLRKAQEIAPGSERLKDLSKELVFKGGDKARMDDLLKGHILTLSAKGKNAREKIQIYGDIISCHEEVYRIESGRKVSQETRERKQRRVEKLQKDADSGKAKAYDDVAAVIGGLKSDEFETVLEELPALLEKMFTFWKVRNENDKVFNLSVYLLKTIPYSKSADSVFEICIKEIGKSVLFDDGLRERKRKNLRKRLINDKVLIDGIKAISEKTFNETLAKELINLFFLNDGAYHAVLSAMLSRQGEKDKLFISTLLGHLNARFSETLIRAITGKGTFLPEIKTIREKVLLFDSIQNAVNNLGEIEFAEEELKTNLYFCLALMNLAARDFDGAIPFFDKSLKGEFRLKARRLLVHAYLGKGDRAGAFQVFYAMHKEAPYSSVVNSARNKLGIGKDDSILWNQTKFGMEHLLLAPFRERMVYFGVPLLLTQCLTPVITGLMGVSPSVQTSVLILASLQILSGIFFVLLHKHGWKTALLVTGLNIFMPFVIETGVWQLLTVAVALHSVVNLTAFITNTVVGRKAVPYATIRSGPASLPPTTKKMPPVITPVAVIGIVGADEGAMEKKYPIIKNYANIEFIAVKNKEAFEKIATEAGLKPHVLIEMREETDMEDAIKEAVRIAEIQALANMFPYLIHPYAGGLDEGAMMALEGKTLDDMGNILNVLQDVLPDEAHHDVLGSIMRDYYPRALAGEEFRFPSIVPGDNEKWADEYCKSAGEAVTADRDDSLSDEEKADLRDRFLGYHSGFVKYLNDNPKMPFGDLLDFKNMAAKHEDEKIKGMEKSLMELIPEVPKAIVIDTRFPGVDIGEMIPAIKAFADKRFYICVATTRDVPIPEEIISLKNVIPVVLDPNRKKENISNTVKEVLKSLEVKGVNIRPADVSMAAVESGALTENLINYMRAEGKENVPGFVLLGKNVLTDDAAGKRINRILPEVAVVSLLKRTLDEKDAPRIMAVECAEETLKRLEKGLKDILHLLIKITRLNIGEEIRQEIDAITKTAVAL